LSSWTGFGSNRVVTDYMIPSEILNIRTTLLYTQSKDWKQNTWGLITKTSYDFL